MRIPLVGILQLVHPLVVSHCDKLIDRRENDAIDSTVKELWSGWLGWGRSLLW